MTLSPHAHSHVRCVSVHAPTCSLARTSAGSRLFWFLSRACRRLRQNSIQLESFRSSLAVYIDNSRVFMTSYCCTRTVHRERERGREGERPAQGNQQQAYVKPITYIWCCFWVFVTCTHLRTYKQQAPSTLTFASLCLSFFL